MPSETIHAPRRRTGPQQQQQQQQQEQEQDQQEARCGAAAGNDSDAKPGAGSSLGSRPPGGNGRHKGAARLAHWQQGQAPSRPDELDEPDFAIFGSTPGRDGAGESWGGGGLYLQKLGAGRLARGRRYTGRLARLQQAYAATAVLAVVLPPPAAAARAEQAAAAETAAQGAAAGLTLGGKRRRGAGAFPDLLSPAFDPPRAPASSGAVDPWEAVGLVGGPATGAQLVGGASGGRSQGRPWVAAHQRRGAEAAIAAAAARADGGGDLCRLLVRHLGFSESWQVGGRRVCLPAAAQPPPALHVDHRCRAQVRRTARHLPSGCTRDVTSASRPPLPLPCSCWLCVRGACAGPAARVLNKPPPPRPSTLQDVAALAERYGRQADAICALRCLQRLAHHLPRGVGPGVRDAGERAALWRLVRALAQGLEPALGGLEPKVGAGVCVCGGVVEGGGGGTGGCSWLPATLPP
jgi:hypothetical protein